VTPAKLPLNVMTYVPLAAPSGSVTLALAVVVPGALVATS
jgi:hypothetical protein